MQPSGRLKDALMACGVLLLEDLRGSNWVSRGPSANSMMPTAGGR